MRVVVCRALLSASGHHAMGRHAQEQYVLVFIPSLAEQVLRCVVGVRPRMQQASLVGCRLLDTALYCRGRCLCCGAFYRCLLLFTVFSPIVHSLNGAADNV